MTTTTMMMMMVLMRVANDDDEVLHVEVDDQWMEGNDTTIMLQYWETGI